MKCFILILNFFVSFQANAEAEIYKLERNKVVDHRNQVVSARKLDSFNSKAKKAKTRYELNQKVKYSCHRPSKSQKRGEGRIESIRGIGAKHFVKVQGCDYLVNSSVISSIEEKLPQKSGSKAKAIASVSQ